MCFNLHALLDPRIIVSNLGISLSMLGVWIVYLNSPINAHVIDGGVFDEEAESQANSQETITRRKNRNMTRGVFIVLVGSGLQILSSAIEGGQ